MSVDAARPLLVAEHARERGLLDGSDADRLGDAEVGA